MCHRNFKKSSCMKKASNKQVEMLGTAKETSRRMRFYAFATVFLLINLVARHVNAGYQLPIQQRLLNQNHIRHNIADSHHARGEQPVSIKRIDNQEQQQQVSASGDDSEQLRQLHQAVDTVARLLNEEEEEQLKSGRAQQKSASVNEDQEQRNEPRLDMLSETAIRQAIEQLEKIQQQERLEAQVSESRLRPVISEAPQTSGPTASALQSRQTIAGLIDELGDEMINDQLIAASQEAERLLVGQNQSFRAGEKSSSNLESVSEKPRVRDSQPATSTAPNYQEHQINNSSPLFSGQLDSLASELGSALTNDFYTFHAESNGSGDRSEAGSKEPPPHSDDNRLQPQSQQQQSSEIQRQEPSALNDLESAAQTRNSVAQQELQPSSNFEQQPGTLRFDFSQPASVEPPQQRLPSQANRDALVRAFRQQTGASLDNTNQFPPTSTLLPIPNQDNFWRPSSGSTNHVDNGDINQQYSRARGSQQPELPPLPPPRFQSSNAPIQFPQQPESSSRQSQHIHYTGHSLVPSNSQPQFPAPQQNSREHRSFSSTTAPLISVLSGSDTSSGNSVTWNPPATLNPPAHSPPPQQAFNQLFPTSTQSSQHQTLNTDSLTQYYPTLNRGPPSPLFKGAFQGLTENNLNSPQQKPQSEFRPQMGSNFPTSTEINSLPESTTEDRFPPATTTQWSSPAAFQPIAEREVSDSQPHTSIRSLSGNQRNFSPNDLSSPASTLPSINTEPPRNSRINSSGLSTTTVAPTSSTTANSTKKEDMVIYYYYYYDDNKNATVVAKNVSSTASTANPLPLEAAIEADGGVEDTPYMDDPAPITNTRANIFKPTSTTSTTTTTTTTSSSVSPSSTPISNNNLESTIHDNRARIQASSSRTSAVSDSQSPSRSSQFGRLSSEIISSNDLIKQSQTDQQRVPSTANNRGSSHHSRQPAQDLVSTFTPTPNQPSTTSSLRPVSRVSVDQVSSSRHISTESPDTHSSQIGHSNYNRVSPQPVHQHHGISTTPNSKLQTDLIQNVLNGISSRQTTSSSTASTPVASNTSSNRGPLSNASRYGTNNNLMLDPYGLDPSAPATLVHSSHQSGSDTSGNQHHKTWQQGSAVQNVAHQSNRKPTVSSATDIPSANHPSSTENLSLLKNQATQNNPSRLNNQHFSPHRNLNVASPSPIPSRAPLGSGSRSPSSSPIAAQQTNKQIFPESSHSGSAVVEHQPKEHLSRVSTQQPPKQMTDIQISTVSRIQQSNRQTTAPSNEFGMNRLISSSETEAQNLPKESQPMIQSNNGRPSTPDGNTGNGFTRSSIQVSSVSTPATILSTSAQRSQGSTSERKLSVNGLQASSTPSTISTSVSKSFVTPQQVQVTTSVSPPTITSTSTVTSVSQSSSSTPQNSIQPQTTISNPTSIQTTSASQETSSPTESTDSASSSTRKKFGNRTNRFQTRLSAATSKSSTTTTSTTPAPAATSTTRRVAPSTTRKSSKQLFAGRRRLSSFQSESNNNSQANATLQTGNATVASPVLDSSTPASSSSPSRARFGNSFTARGRSSSSSSGTTEQNGSTQKPNLFGAQRATSKPRLPFLKPNKMSSVAGGLDSIVSNQPEATTSSNSSILAAGSVSTTSLDKLSADKPAGSETLEDSTDDSSSAEEDSIEMKKESSPSPSPAPAPASVSTSAPAPQSNNSLTGESITTTQPSPAQQSEPVNGRNKPKLRPLFASRQRSSSLFGNRRSNSTTTT